MPLIPPKEVRYPRDERLVELAKLKPIGWWSDHARVNPCCQTGVPGCDLGDALARLHTRELVRRS